MGLFCLTVENKKVKICYVDDMSCVNSSCSHEYIRKKRRVGKMNTSVFESYESEVRSYCRHFPTVFKRSVGSYFIDEEGTKYIDFFCGAGAVNYGHNNPEIKKKLIEYLENDGIIHALDMYTVPKREFIETLEEKILKPRGLDYKIQFPGPTGTNANEAALKLARKVKGRRNVFAFMGAFHGMTLGSLALTTDKASRRGAGVPLDNVTFIPAPYMFPDHSGIEKPAALFLETIQAEGGIRVFDAEWLRRVRKFCDDNDILMIVDDVQVGCCRSGDFFSFERAGIQPDIVTMSKSIGGYGLPLAITLIKPELDIWKPGEHNGTFRGNQMAFVAAKAGLDYMLENKIEDAVKAKSVIVKKFIEKEILPLDSRLEARGIGLIWGIDFEKFPVQGLADKVEAKCFERKMIIEGAGRKNSVVKLMPPLTISEEELKGGLEIIRDSIKDILAENN